MNHYRAVIHAYEGIYGGLHGMESWHYTEANTEEELENEAHSASWEIIESYSCIMDMLEDEDIEIYEENIENDIAYDIFYLQDEIEMDWMEIEDYLVEDPEGFVEEYCL